MLIHFLHGLIAAGQSPTLLAVPNTRLTEQLPASLDFRPLTSNQPFRPGAFLRQLGDICRAIDPHEPPLLHAWAARDWDVAAVAGKLTDCPAIGTLHDHPRAPFISPGRQRLMRMAATRGLDRIVTVSDAVGEACRRAGYPVDKLTTIHNGLPPIPAVSPRKGRRVRLGFLGAFSERKGLRLLFELLRRLAQATDRDWELQLAGEAQNAEGRALWEQLQQRHGSAAWWKRVRPIGWVTDAKSFLSGIDLLIFPSSEFDPLPTVILEAGQCATPVFAAAVGGVPEMVEPDKTGWLFDPAKPEPAAIKLAELIARPARLRTAGANAADHIARNFSLGKMIEQYLGIYSTLRGG